MHVRRTLTGLVCGVLLALPALAHAGSPVGWVRATRYAKQRSRPTLFYPGNLLDASGKTVFCVDRAEAVGTRIIIGFKGSPEASELRVLNGDNRGPAFYDQAAQVAALVIHETTYTRELPLQASRAQQVVRLDPPVKDDRIEVEIKAVQGEGELVCLSDLIFVSRGKALSGSWMGRDLKHHSSREKLLGVWAAGPEGAAEKFLSLYMDGTFKWVYVPNDPDLKPKKLSGKWSGGAGRLVLQVGQESFGMSAKRSKGEDEMGEPLERLQLEGAKKGSRVESVPDVYRDRWL